MPTTPLSEREIEAELDRADCNSGELATAVADDVLAPYRAAAGLLGGDAREQSTFAARVFLNVAHERALLGLLEGPPRSAELQAWSVRTVAEAGLGVTQRLVAWIDPMLDDTRPAPAPFSRRKGSRLCDEAFLTARSFIVFDEPELADAFDEEAFFGWPERRRDALIKTMRRTRSYRRVKEGG